VSEYFEQTTSAIKALHGAWTALMSVDSSHTTIEPWIALEGKIPPLGSSSSFPKSKARLDGKYLQDVKLAWTSWTEPTTFRFILGHSKPIEDYLENQSCLRKLDTLEVIVMKEKLQTSVRAITGYLAAPLITGDTADDLANILQAKAIITLNGVTEVEIRDDFISTQWGNIRKEFDESVVCTSLLLPKLKPKPDLAWAANIPATPALIILSVFNIDLCRTLRIRISQFPPYSGYCREAQIQTSQLHGQFD
jgi:hypothetical protein